MKRIITFTIILIALVACSTPQTQAPTDAPQANLPNPASVYCEQNGNKFEVVVA